MHIKEYWAKNIVIQDPVSGIGSAYSVIASVSSSLSTCPLSVLFYAHKTALEIISWLSSLFSSERRNHSHAVLHSIMTGTSPSRYLVPGNKHIAYPNHII